MGTIEVIAEHSVDTSLLTGGICLDIGCLGFEFSSEMVDRGCKVFAFDLVDMDPPPGVIFVRTAVSDFNGIANFKKTNDRQAWHLDNDGFFTVQSTTISSICNLIGYKNIEIIKLDCEGSEYEILSDENLQPIPQQWSIEWHEHSHKYLHDMYFEKCIENLARNYDIVKLDRYEAHGAGMNYWDSLFIRKD